MSEAKKFDINVDFHSDLDSLQLKKATYDQFAEIIYNLAGIDLPYSAKNEALIRNRMVKVMRRRGIDKFESYLDIVKKAKHEDIQEFVSAMTTNLTSFYRESDHFVFMTQKLPEFVQKCPEVRIWCAAASTGQEPYTIAITSREAVPDNQIGRVRILATDIDLQVLKKGSQGIYDEREMQGLSPQLRQKYFDKAVGKNGTEFYRSKDTLNRMLTFAQFNLMNERYEFKNKFQIVICRNVLIYFDEETTKKVVDRLVSCVEPGGYLILGHSESGNVKHPQLKPLSKAIYQKV